MSEQIPNKKSPQEGLSEVQAEKLFWKKTVEEIKETDFRHIYEIIFSDIESGNYVLARQVLNEELKKIIAKVSPTMYGNTSQRGFALMVLKEEFYKIFPEIEDLTRETKEESESEVKDPTVRLGEPVEMDIPAEGEFREGFRNPYLVEKLEWPEKLPTEFVLGLAGVIFDQKLERLITIEFLERAYYKGDDLFAKVKIGEKLGLAAVVKEIKLADYGLAANAKTGLWNSRFIPASRWQIKKDK
ncbi:MAG: hypothetical protein Q8R34_00015 [bacterium]|nr:hypothetical protein [bacterium]